MEAGVSSSLGGLLKQCGLDPKPYRILSSRHGETHRFIAACKSYATVPLQIRQTQNVTLKSSPDKRFLSAGTAFGGITGFGSVFGIHILNTSPFVKNRCPDLCHLAVPAPGHRGPACGFRFDDSKYQGLVEQFSTRGPHTRPGMSSNVWSHFWSSQKGLLASSGWRPGMLPPIPQCLWSRRIARGQPEVPARSHRSSLLPFMSRELNMRKSSLGQGRGEGSLRHAHSHSGFSNPALLSGGTG